MITGHKTSWTCSQKHKSWIHMKTGFFNLAVSMKFPKKCLKWFSGIFFHVFAIISSFTSKRWVVLHDICNKRLWRWTLVSWKVCFWKWWCNSPNPICFPWVRQTLIFGNFTQVIKMRFCIGFFHIVKIHSSNSFILTLLSPAAFDAISFNWINLFLTNSGNLLGSLEQ